MSPAQRAGLRGSRKWADSAIPSTAPGEDAATTAEVLGIAESAHFLEPLKPAR